MASYNHQPLMIQAYHDDVDQSNVGANTTLLSSPAGQGVTQPRWANRSPSSKRLRRFLGTAIVVLASIYLLFCTWIALVRRDQTTSYGNSIGEDSFPHRTLPWPFPRPHPRHPHPGPPHHPPFGDISVLGCSPISPPGSDLLKEGTKLKVTYPVNSSVILDDWLLLGDVGVSKVAEEDAAEDQATLEVFIKVGKLIKSPLPDTEDAMEGGVAFETMVIDEEDEDNGFVLCAITFVHPPPPPQHPHHPTTVGEVPPHPPSHPHHPPVVVKIFPALNETYPKLPPPPPPPHHHPPCHRKSHSIPTKFFKTAISFLFPMLSESPQPLIGHRSHVPGHPSHPPHRGLFPPPPHHPPPPPFIVESLEAKVARSSPVHYGRPFPPPHFRRPHPFPHPPHY